MIKNSYFFSLLIKIIAVLIITCNQTLGGDINFWEQKLQIGANVFNVKIERDLINTAKNYGMKFLRIAPDKFKSNDKDFLIGNADNYDGLNQVDLST